MNTDSACDIILNSLNSAWEGLENISPWDFVLLGLYLTIHTCEGFNNIRSSENMASETRGQSAIKGKQTFYPQDIAAESGDIEETNPQEFSEVAILKKQIQLLQEAHSRQQVQTQQDLKMIITLIQTSQTAGSQTPSLIKTTRSVKIPDPTKLSNRSLLKIKHWEIAIHTKLHVNHDHFETEEAKIFYIYDHTEGDAQEHRYSHCKPDALWPFKTVSEVIQYLAKIYRDPYCVRNAGLKYQALKMKIGQLFHEFKIRFLQLANKAEIAENHRFYNLYDKLTISLQDTIKINL